jgi:FkbM family methyltransferase
MSEQRLKLESGIELHAINAIESSFLLTEVEDYFSHGIELSPGATIIDAGANIGVFSARAYERLHGDVHIYAFEPLLPIFRVLAKNAEEFFAGHITALPYGLGAKEEELDFTYFPLLTVLSSSRRSGENLASEKLRVGETILELIKSGRAYPHLKFLPEEMLQPMVESMMASMMRREVHRARVRRLSSCIEELKIDTIDLLKIDVEGAELDVLAGIDDADFARIRQVVVEVETSREREPAVRSLLASKGFLGETVQDRVQEAGDFALVYARRPRP